MIWFHPMNDIHTSESEARVAELEKRVRLLTWWASRGWIGTDYSESKSEELFSEMKRQATVVSDEYKAAQ